MKTTAILKTALTGGVIAVAALMGFQALTADTVMAESGPEEEAVSATAILKDIPGVSTAALNAEVQSLFDDEQYAETRALVIMRGGDIVVEQYAAGYDADTRFISWSMAKSVTAVLIGLMVSDGKLSLDSPAPVPAWQQPGDPRGAITLRQLLHMTSGLEHSEAADPIYNSDEVRMLFRDGRDDMAAYAEAQPLEAEPGSKYEYSSNTSVILADIITRQITASENPDVRRRAMIDFMEGRLFEPLGLDSMVPEFDASGTMIGGSMIHADARDWARFGEFLRNKGSVNGNQILPRKWFDFMLAPSPHDPAYAGHIWLNRMRPSDRNMVLFPGNGMDDIFACLGHLGQFVIVSPSQRLVAVRLGKTPDNVRRPVHDQMGRIIGLFPRS